MVVLIWLGDLMLRSAILERFNHFKFEIFARIGIPATFASSFKNGLSTHYLPDTHSYSIASNKRVSSGASFTCKKTINYSTRKLE